MKKSQARGTPLSWDSGTPPGGLIAPIQNYIETKSNAQKHHDQLNQKAKKKKRYGIAKEWG